MFFNNIKKSLLNVDEHEKDIIRGAMEEYHEKSCVRFRPYKKGDDDFVLIRGDSPGCWSFVGKRGGGQVVNLKGRCVQHGVAVHELLHALGFHHQQSATNRDDYIKIHWQNIFPSMNDIYTMQMMSTKYKMFN